MSDPADTNFSPRAKRVLALSWREAERLNQNWIGSEHVFMGLIALGEGMAFNVLQKLGLKLQVMKLELETYARARSYENNSARLIYTPRVKKIIALAMEEAKELKHEQVGTEHILLGFFREGASYTAQTLNKLDVDLATTRAAVLTERRPTSDH